MKRIFLTGFVLAVAGVVVSFCAPQPDWLSGDSKKYPGKDYLVGLGMGYTADAAKSAARAEISKVFSVSVQQTSMDTNKESTQSKPAKKVKQSEVSAETQTTTSTTGTLEGVEIADNWYNKKTKNYYALAVLSKAKVKQQLSSQITDLEESIQQQTAMGKNASSNIEKVRAFSIALKTWDKKDGLVAKRNILDSIAVPEIDLGDSKAALKILREDAINHIAFVVDSGSRPSLGTFVSGKISGLGFKTLPSAPLQPNKSLSVISVKCSVEVAPFDRGNPNWKFYTWKAGAQLSEIGGPAGNFGDISEQGESSHLSDETAKSKAYIDADNSISQGIEQRIRQNILGE